MQVYAASIMFGYFLRRVDQRFQVQTCWLCVCARARAWVCDLVANGQSGALVRTSRCRRGMRPGVSTHTHTHTHLHTHLHTLPPPPPHTSTHTHTHSHTPHAHSLTHTHTHTHSHTHSTHPHSPHSSFLQLEKSLGTLEVNREDAVARLEKLFSQADAEDAPWDAELASGGRESAQASSSSSTTSNEASLVKKEKSALRR